MTYSFVEEEEPSYGTQDFAEDVVRNVARQTSNLTTRAVGLSGDILSLVNEYIAKPITEKVFDQKSVPYEQTFLGKALPTTETHRKNIEEATGEYLKPKNKIEQFADDIIEDTALLMIPGGKAIKLAKTRTGFSKFIAPVSKAIGANLLGKVVEQQGGSEEAGQYTKMGSLFLLSLIDKKSAAQQLGDLYKTAESKLPQGAQIASNKLDSNIKFLEDKITKGRPVKNLAPSEKFVIDEIDKIKELTKSGHINIEQAVAQKRSLNENLSKHVYESSDKGASARAKKLAKNLNKDLNEVIKDYGHTNPEYYKYFKSADEGFGVLAQSNFVSRFVEKNLKSSPLTHGLLHLFGSSIGTAASGAVLPYQGVKLGYRIAKSKTLRGIYKDTLNAAIKEDAASFNKYLHKLDDAIQEDESKDRYSFID
jgi:hypothetical protein